jgi:hypothetical protein
MAIPIHKCPLMKFLIRIYWFLKPGPPRSSCIVLVPLPPGPARSTDTTARASECRRRRRPAHPVLQKTTCARAAACLPVWSSSTLHTHPTNPPIQSSFAMSLRCLVAQPTAGAYSFVPSSCCRYDAWPLPSSHHHRTMGLFGSAFF